MTKIKTYKAVKNLLGKSNAKTIKGESKGVTTYILYLAPHTQNKYKINLCPFASKGCALACLYTSGRGKFSNVQEARQNKTTYYLEDKLEFIEQLDRELTKIEAKHKKDGSKFAVRLNGTSDINFRGLISRFPEVTFYDYTKSLNKAINNNLANYDLTFSASESNKQEVVEALSKGVKVAIVTSFDISEIVGTTYKGKTFVNGDETDLRFLDPKSSIVLLSAKGEAKKDTDGFVYHTIESVKELIDIDASGYIVIYGEAKKSNTEHRKPQQMWYKYKEDATSFHNDMIKEGLKSMLLPNKNRVKIELNGYGFNSLPLT